MLSELLQYINKWYVNSLETQTFTIVSDGIEGTFSQNYVVGQYISIDNSILNDGVYKLTGVTASKLSVAETLQTEAVNTVFIWGLAIPPDIVNLSIAIDIHIGKSQDGIASESQGGRSISYANNSTWSSVFGARLSKYRSLVSDKVTYNQYDIRTKGLY